jgi:hypothetical protein
MDVVKVLIVASVRIIYVLNALLLIIIAFIVRVMLLYKLIALVNAIEDTFNPVFLVLNAILHVKNAMVQLFINA